LRKANSSMTMRISVDTSMLVALIDSHDKWHLQAVAIRDVLKSTGAEVLYFDCVVNETVTVLARRLLERGRSDHFGPLLSRLEDVVSDAKITWVSQETRSLYREILLQIRASDGRLSFHDALIALVCRDMGIEYIASFDQDLDEVAWLTRVGNPTVVDHMSST